jgi:hypothetical protein
MEDYDNIDVPWLVESICRRPTWFTATGSLSEVLCYLSGVYAGMLAPGASPEQRERARKVWYGFLGKTPGLLWPPMGEWHELEQALRADFADDAAALAQLAERYRAYRRRLEGKDIDQKQEGM